MFLAGEGGEGGGFDQNKLIGMAMAQAGKIWDEKEAQGARMVSICISFFDFFYVYVLRLRLRSGRWVGRC